MKRYKHFESDRVKEFVDNQGLWKGIVERGNFASSVSDCWWRSCWSPLRWDPKTFSEDCCRETWNRLDQKFISMWGWNCWRGPSGAIIYLYHESSAKVLYSAVELQRFWISVSVLYAKVGRNVMKLLEKFSTTYLCEAGTSVLDSVKTNFVNRLNVQSYLRCALGRTLPNTDHFVSQKNFSLIKSFVSIVF